MTDLPEASQPPRGEGIVAILRKKDRYLLIQRASGIRAGGMWCFVGGAIEPGESQEQALIREVSEEVGLEVEPGKKVWECLSQNREWVLHCWLTESFRGKIKLNPREVAAYEWLTAQEIEQLPNVLPSVLEYFNNKGDATLF